MNAKTCLRYPGGKFYGAKNILPFCDTLHNNYIEPFIGGATIFLKKSMAPKLNWINDKDPDLINFYKIIQNKAERERLYELINNEKASRERHKEVLSMRPKDKIERAFKYFYLNRTSFSGIMHKPRWGYLIGSSVTPDRWINIISPVAKRLENVRITNLDFREVFAKIDNNNKTLIYLDPPYFKASKAIYQYEFTKKDHLDLLNILRKTKCKFILSYEDCAEIRNMYNWAKLHKINFRYYMSEGRRQNGSELIITNFK